MTDGPALSTPATMPPPSYRTMLVALVAIAILLTMPYEQNLTSQLPGARPGSLTRTVVSRLVQLAISYGIIRLGLALGARIGLAWPPLSGWNGELGAGAVIDRVAVRRALVTSAIVGTVIGLLVVAVAAPLEDQWPCVPMKWPAWWVVLLASIGAGIHEEVWFRLGVMTVLAWLGARLTGRTTAGPVVLWGANVGAALLFGAIHLPQAAAMSTLEPSLVAFVLAANGVVGLACGWLYWRHGLVAAMVAHAVVDIVMKVLVPLVVPS